MVATLQDNLRERDLLPHQVEFIEEALRSGTGGRLLLADAVGLGKTRASAALVWAWSQTHGRRPRTVILAPQALLSRWQASLADFEVVDGEIVDSARFRHLEARSRTDENPWGSVNTVLTTVDFLRRDDRLRTLVRASWDLVIVDEAHVGAAGSQRSQVLRTLWEANTVDLMVAVSATPAGRLDDLTRSSGKTTRVLQRFASDLVDWNGEPILGDAVAKIVEIVQLQFSAQERDLLEKTRSLLHDATTDEPLQRFLSQLYVRAAASSLFTFENLLRRALVRLDRQDIASVHDSVPAAADDDDTEDPTDETLPPPLERESLLRLIGLMDLIEVDTKWSTCAQVLQSRLPEAGGSGVIFSDFVYTAQYVAGLVAEGGTPVELVTGASPLEDREQALRSFRRNGGVFVVTSGAAEGLELSFVKLCIHYDVPWNSAALAQRLGRIHRIGATLGPVRHVLFADEIFLREPLVKRFFTLHEDAGNAAVAEVLSDILGTR